MHILVVSGILPAAAALSRTLQAAGFILAGFTHAHLEGHAPSWPHSANEPAGPARQGDTLAASASAHPTNFRDDPAAIVLDCDRPTGHGECPVRQLRALGYRLPVLVLAARHSPAAEVQYFENGADDYIAKPYAVPVLLARLRALTRRAGPGSPCAVPSSWLRVGDLSLDLAARVAHRGGRTIELTNREFLLLRLLMRHAGQLCLRKFILEIVWGYDFKPGTNIVDSNINRLRKKIATEFETQPIHTVPWKGYLLKPE